MARSAGPPDQADCAQVSPPGAPAIMTRSIERPVQLTVAGREVSLGDGRPFFLSGPCVLQERGLTLEIATALDEIFRSRNVPFVFKASFDKANRSSLGSGRGPGLEEGLEWLAEVRESLSVPIVTDVAAEIEEIRNQLLDTDSRTECEIARPPPSPGQHSDEALGEWGFTGEEIAKLRDAKALA